MQTKNIIQRALELAHDCRSFDEVRRKLKAEGYEHVDAHLEGRKIRTELKARLKIAQF